MKYEWAPIRDSAVKQAASLGHTVSVFKKQPGHHPLKMATCEACLGCCWIGVHPSRGFIMGGRLLKYRCGTHEAAGTLAPAHVPQTQTPNPTQHAGGNVGVSGGKEEA